MGNQIMLPEVSLSLVSADLEVANAPQKVLFVGIVAAGTVATPGTLVQNIPNDGSEDVLFGPLSPLAEAIKMFKSIAPGVQVDAIPTLNNTGGTKAAYTITITGDAEEAGTITLILGSNKRHKIEVPVTNGVTASALATEVVSAINGAYAPFSASSALGVITLTHAIFGTFGNNVPIGFELNGAFAGAITGITVALAQSVQGATNPTALATSAIFDVVGNNRYQGVVWPDPTTFSVAADWLDTRFNVNNRILDGILFCHKTDTYSNCLAAPSSVNSKSGVLFVDKKISNTAGYFGPAGREIGFVVAAAFAAVRALRLTKGAAISQYLTTKASGDQFGGTALASLPYFNTTIPQLSTPVAGNGFTDTEIGFLEAQGASIIGQNSQGTNVLVGTVSTTYKTDPAGNVDISWKYLNYVDTMSAVREYFFNNYKKRFAQSRLTDGTVIRSRDMVNKPLFEAYTDQLYGDLTGSDFVLCQAGELALNFFKKNREVGIDMATGTVDVNMLVPIVTQARKFIGTIKIAFNTEG